MGKTKWHESERARSGVGLSGEAKFDRTWDCHCGGEFEANDSAPGRPDRKCVRCSQLVDVKAPPNVLKYKHLTISKIPFDNYPDGMIIALLAGGLWWGLRKREAKARGPLPPTHKERGTDFYKISLANFSLLHKLLKKK